MSVAVARPTVRLWPAGGSPLRSAPPDRPAGPASEAPASEALAAIASRYRHGRAGIIAGDLPPTHSTVPVALLPARRSAPVVRQDVAPVVTDGLSGDQDDEAPTFWTRLVRSRRPAPRGRHSLRP